MNLDVRLTVGAPPQMAVSGQTIETLRADRLADGLSGRKDLIQRVMRHQGYGLPIGEHLSDADGLPENLVDAFVR